MNNELLPVLTGMVLDEETTLTMGELCHACAVHAEWIIELVDEGILDPVESSRSGQWRFPAIALQRVHIVQRLQRDLGVNLAGAALVMDLMDEIEWLRSRLRALDHE